MIISDGMGNGGQAAHGRRNGGRTNGQTDQVWVWLRLLAAGVNSAMLFKSTDESLATIDVASVDLFTGMAELLKARAAPTFVRRNGRTGKAECPLCPLEF